MRIALDAMGGDYAPKNIIEGAVLALKEYSYVEKLYLVGDAAAVENELKRLDFSDPRIEIFHASQVISMKESAAKAVRQKKDVKNAFAHAQGSKPLARGAIDKVPAMRQSSARPHRLPFMRLLPGSPGVDYRSRLNRGWPERHLVRTQAKPHKRGANFLLIELPSCVKQPSYEEYSAKCRSGAV